VFGAERSVSELSTRTQAQRESRSVQMEFNRRGGWKPVQGGAAKASRPQGGIMGTLSERQRALHRTFIDAKKGGNASYKLFQPINFARVKHFNISYFPRFSLHHC